MDNCFSPAQVERYPNLTRRSFALGGLLLGTSRAARAQKPKVYRMAVWDISRPITEMVEQTGATQYRAFFAELERLGFQDGQNLRVERYSSVGRPADTYRE